MKSLVVEDEFAPRLVLQRFLNVHGPCEVATTAAEALAAVRLALEQKTPYQVICLDIELPDGSGQEVLKQIRRLEAEFTVPDELHTRVLMTSGHSEAEQVKASFYNGSDGFLVKPVDPQRLQRKLCELGLIAT